ncbi:MAG: transporter substrate-binding domain-containing protein [Alphaproteobacteria bacterium]|nr:transporter substrate-binding domain-containing protein [Alphaproteobacteria bacterium]
MFPRLFKLCLTLSTVFILTLYIGISAKANDVKGCFTTWPPYTYMDNDEPKGITVDVMQEAARRKNFNLELNNLPWNRCLRMVQQNQMHFAMDSLPRAGYKRIKSPSAIYIQTFWQRKSAKSDILTYYGQITDQRLALIQGYKYSDDLLEAGFSHIEWVKDETTAARLIERERLDLLFGDVVVMQHILNRDDFQLKPMMPVQSVDFLFPAFNLGQSEIANQFDDAVASMHADGTMDKIYTKHIGLSYTGLVKLSRGGILDSSSSNPSN